MSKDPAFLFYPADFLVGTMLFSDEQVGKYIRSLCFQHQRGRLTEKQIMEICKGYDEEIFSKFAKDENGLYYNKRLERESLKRARYTESRRANLAAASQSKDKNQPAGENHVYENHMPSHMDSHMGLHMENENINKNEIVNTDKDTLDESNSAREDESGESLLVETATGETETAETVSHSLTRKPRQRKNTGALTKEQQKRFDIFWQAWPNKKSPGQAEVTFAKINPDDGLLQEILAGIGRAKKYDHRFREIRYTPYPSSWLSVRGWEDKFEEGGVIGGERGSHPPVFTPSTGFQTE